MKYKKGLIFICLLICLFNIASVVASDTNETVVTTENQSDVDIDIIKQESNTIPINTSNNNNLSEIGGNNSEEQIFKQVNDDIIDYYEYYNNIDAEIEFISIEAVSNKPVILNVQFNFVQKEVTGEKPHGVLGSSQLYIDNKLAAAHQISADNWNLNSNGLYQCSVKSSYTSINTIALTGGKHNLRLDYVSSEGNKTISAKLNRQFSVLYDPNIIISNSKYSRNYTISVKDYDSKPIKIEVTINGPNGYLSSNSYYTNSNGVYNGKISGNLGKYLISVSVLDNGYSNEKINKTINVIDINMTLVEGKILHYGTDNKYTLKVVDTDGNVLSNKKINVGLYDDYMNCIKQGSYTTNSLGEYSDSLNHGAGNYHLFVKLSVTSSDIRRFSFSIVMYSDESSIIVQNYNSVYLSSKNYDIKVVDSKGNPLENAQLNIRIYSDNLKYNNEIVGTTNSNGIYSVPIKLNVGKYNVHVELVEDNYNAVADSSIIINKNNVKISANIIKSDTYSKTKLKVKVTDNSGKLVNEGVIKFIINGNSYRVNVINGYAYKTLKLSKAKTYKYQAIFTGNNYISNTASSKIKIIKFKVKLSAKKYTNFKGKNSILKVIVKNGLNQPLNGGSVKFLINGKTYKAKVHNGIAKKKVKLSKIKTYTYKAILSLKDYTSKAGKSKVIVKKIPTFKIKIGKYSVTISYKDYKKIKKAQYDGYFHKQYYTGKKISYKVFADKKVTKYKNKLLAHSWYSNGQIHSVGYNSANYAPEGYTYVGAKIVHKGSDIKEYQVYKKTITKKVLVKIKKTKVYIIINSDENWGSSAQLYYIKYKYGGETRWHLGNSKSIF